MRRTMLVMITTVILVLAGTGWAVAGGGGHGGSACRGFGEGDSLLMRDHCFEGVGHVATAGQAVTVTNVGNAPHSITAADGSFDSGDIAPGESYELTLDETGVVPIYCTLHGNARGDGMAGLVVVQAADLGDAEPAASPVGSNSWPWIGALAVLVLIGGALGLRRRALAVTATDD